jgi:hypothetical protein
VASAYSSSSCIAGFLRNGYVESAILVADNWIALVAKLVKVWVVDPDILRELELPHQAGAKYERSFRAFESWDRQSSMKNGAVAVSCGKASRRCSSLLFSITA